VACRACWMLGANEVLGYPRIFSNKFLKKYFLFVSQNFLRPFLVVHQTFSISSPKMSDDIFSHLPNFFHFFASVFTFHKNSLLECPPELHHAPVTTFFSSFFSHLPTFLTKTSPLDAPRVDARGRRIVRTPYARHCLSQ